MKNGYEFWDAIKSKFPGIADGIFKEFTRVDGYLPYEKGYVYMLHACGTSYYKIGKSCKPDRRFTQISPQMPFKTKVINVWRSNFMSMGEDYVHEMFAEKRTNGEWFDLDTIDFVNFFAKTREYLRNRIRNAYGYYFFTEAIDCYEDCFDEWLEEETNYLVSTFWCTPHSMAWIDGLFQAIEFEQSEIPPEIQSRVQSYFDEDKKTWVAAGLDESEYVDIGF